MGKVVDIERICARDTKSYFGVLLDNNNRKPICRLRFNTAQKYISIIINAEKDEMKEPIDSLNDIYKYADQLKNTVGFYDE